MTDILAQVKELEKLAKEQLRFKRLMMSLRNTRAWFTSPEHRVHSSPNTDWQNTRRSSLPYVREE